MNITGVTRRDIFNLFNEGIEQSDFWEMEPIYYPYYGKFEIVDFLKRLYDLSNMESMDSRLKNAEEDIIRHTQNNDYPDNWVFNDERFGLKNGSDEVFLNFFCEVFHPEVRDEKKDWNLFLGKINELLHEDGYELFVLNFISGRAVFSWRRYIKKSSNFIPFSERNKPQIEDQKIKITIPNSVRYQLFNIMKEYNEEFYLTDKTNWNYNKSISEFVFEDISKFYIPKYRVDSEYVEIKEFNEFEKVTKFFIVFDVIESFDRHTSNMEKFEDEINTIFKLNDIGVELKKYEIHSVNNKAMAIDDSIQIKEYGLEDLLREAEVLYNKNQYSYAVEKLWDAFERLKSYYNPSLNKKKSAEKIIEDISFGNKEIKSMFDSEFKALTEIGNSYRIRHHERDKIDIINDLHYEYFYKRCLSLISVLLKKLN